MSYQVIARKWRPRHFAELIGQDHIRQTLINAIKTDRLPHALLFTGLRGTGKTSSARILAKTLRCQNIKDHIPCETCSDCTDINSGRAVDVIEIDGASNNGVDAIRELRDAVGYMPASGKHKIYIIDEVHMLSTSAFNALLKTLEEPPEHVLFIMATTEVHKVPHTILSRVQRCDFRRIPTPVISESLEKICTAEGVKADKDALWLVARQAEGSLRDSQSLLDQVISFCGNKLTKDSVTEVLGLTHRQLLTDSLEALATRDAATMFGVVEKLQLSGADPIIYCRDLLEEIRHMLLVKVSGGNAGQAVDLPESEIEKLQSISNDLSEEDIHMLFDMSLKGANDISRSQDPMIVLEMLMMRMAHAPRIHDIQKLASGAAVTARPASTTSAPKPRTKTKPKTTAAPATQAANTPEPESPRPVENSLQAKWSDLTARIRPANGALAAKLSNSFLKELTESELHIGIPDKMKFLFDQLNNDEFKGKMKNYIKTFWGADLNVLVSIGTESVDKKKVMTPKAIEKKRAQDDATKTRELVENHPMIQAANELFKTKIVSIKDSVKEKS